MKLPNADQAVVDMRKLTEYCLNTEHPEGKHKALVFASALGISLSHAEQLRDALLAAVQHNDAIPQKVDKFGQRYRLDFLMQTEAGKATVRSGWIIREGEDFPHLATCFVLTE